MKTLTVLFLILLPFLSVAQVTITQLDMPHAGDDLYRTRANLNLGLNYSATGPNHSWNFTNLTASFQDEAHYQTVASTNILYAILYADIFLNPNRANHARAGADISFNNLLPISDPYTFLYRTSSIYKAVGFGAELSGIPTTIPYSNHDEIYNLPINYGNSDSSTAAYNLSLPTLFYYGYSHRRFNVVDGWGTLQTPVGTYDVLRVITTLMITDTIFLDTLSSGTIIVRPIIKEYKWLAPNFRVPILQINTSTIFGFETITDIFFYDTLRTVNIEQPLATNYCPGETFQLNYTTTGMFNSGAGFPGPNTFTTQLSNATGAFSPGVNIGSLTSTQSGVINCMIPLNTPPGNGYRIRINSSNPFSFGDDNGFDLTIHALPVVTIIASGPIQFCSGDSVLLGVIPEPGVTYQWQLNGVDIPNAVDTTYMALDFGTYTLSAISGFGCSNVTIPGINVLDNTPSPIIATSGNTNFCEGDSVTLEVPLVSGYTYQWTLNNVDITGANANELTVATQAGVYSVNGIDSTGCQGTASNPIQITINPVPPVPVITLSNDTLFVSGTGNFQWYLDSILIPGATDTFLVALVDGNYSVSIVDSNGCINYSVEYPYTSVGINVIIADGNISIYPNPSNGIFFIRIKVDQFMFREYVILDLTGREILKSQIQNPKEIIDLQGMATGIYILKISGRESDIVTRLIRL